MTRHRNGLRLQFAHISDSALEHIGGTLSIMHLEPCPMCWAKSPHLIISGPGLLQHITCMYAGSEFVPNKGVSLWHANLVLWVCYMPSSRSLLSSGCKGRCLACTLLFMHHNVSTLSRSQAQLAIHATSRPIASPTPHICSVCPVETGHSPSNVVSPEIWRCT